MKFAIGRKLQMTQLFDDEGVLQPVTVVSLEPLKVTQIKTEEKDKYTSVQVGYGETKSKSPRYKKEFKGDVAGFEVDKEIKAEEIFNVGDVVRISAVSKGKGFQGVVKRYNFAGGPRSHGQKHTERAPGSIGSGLAARVAKGQKMPGRMGSDSVTIKGTKVVLIDKERNLMLLKGPIPGRRGGVIKIQGV